MLFHSLERTQDASTPVLTTAEAKTHLRVDHSDEDTYIDALIDAATKFAEEFTGRAILSQEWKASYRNWPTWVCGFKFFELPRPKLISVDSVKYYNLSNVLTTLSDSYYNAEGDYPASVTFTSSFSDPGLSDDRRYPIEIVFTAGYGVTSDDVPEMLVQAIRLMVKHFYEIRMPVLENINATKVPLSALTLLRHYRFRKL